MISRLIRLNNKLFKRHFSNDRKLPEIKYNNSSLNKKTIGINSERKEDEIKYYNNKLKIKKNKSTDDLLYLLPNKN